LIFREFKHFPIVHACSEQQLNKLETEIAASRDLSFC